MKAARSSFSMPKLPFRICDKDEPCAIATALTRKGVGGGGASGGTRASAPAGKIGVICGKGDGTGASHQRTAKTVNPVATKWDQGVRGELPPASMSLGRVSSFHIGQGLTQKFTEDPIDKDYGHGGQGSASVCLILAHHLSEGLHLGQCKNGLPCCVFVQEPLPAFADSAGGDRMEVAVREIQPSFAGA